MVIQRLECAYMCSLRSWGWEGGVRGVTRWQLALPKLCIGDYSGFREAVGPAMRGAQSGGARDNDPRIDRLGSAGVAGFGRVGLRVVFLGDALKELEASAVLVQDLRLSLRVNDALRVQQAAGVVDVT